MNKEDLLDEVEKEEVVITYKEVLFWWEDRRTTFNFVLLLISALSAYPFGIRSVFIFARFGIIYIILCNILYCFSWGIEMIIRYSREKGLEEKTKKVLFWLGTTIAILPILYLLCIWI